MADIQLRDGTGGRDAAFAQWYGATYPRVARAMTVMFASVDTGREITDEAMVKAFARWGRDDRPVNMDGWVFRVAVNEGRRRWKRRRREADRFADTGANEAAVAELDAPDIDLWRAVADLPPRSREAIVLRYVADLTEVQVAEAMGVATGSASALLTKARRALRAALTDEAADD